MEAAPLGKLYVRDPESGEVSLVDADPETVDSSVEFSGLSDVADPSDPTPFEGDSDGVEAAGVAEVAAVEDVEEVAAAEVEEVAAVVVEEAAVEAVEAVEVAESVVPAPEVSPFFPAPGFAAPKPSAVKRGRPKKDPQ